MPDPPIGSDEDGLSALGAAATVPAKGADKSRPPRARRSGRRSTPLGLGALVVVALVVLLAVVPAVSSGLTKTPRDKVGISYGGGPIEGSHFQRIVQPGSSLFFNGFSDPLYLYPADQQNYIISKVAGQGATKGSDSVVAPTSDRVQVEYQVAAFFKLNTDRLRSFHEQLGLKYKAYTSGGWDNLLKDTFRQQIESALQQETRRYTVNDLVGSADAVTRIQGQVQQTITEQLVSALGQQFFCGPTFVPDADCAPITFVIKKIDIPTAVQTAFNDIQARTNEAMAIDILNEALAKAGENYVKLRAIESGAVTFWVIPEGTGLTLVPGDESGPTPSNATVPSTSTTTTPPTTAPTTTTTTTGGG
ncbi:MAG: SPFH domain-containing protein [Acidimicrobiales bacterium]